MITAGEFSPRPTAEAEAFRTEVRAFLARHLPPGWAGIGELDEAARHDFVDRWRSTLFEAGYLAPDWPVEYGGGGMTPLEQVVLAEELARAGVPGGGPNDGFGIGMLGNTLLIWGTAEQKATLLPRILRGDDRWCQGYSEPNAGSDLGNVALDARRDGDRWILSGQKIWTSRALSADHIFALARTDREAPKHAGISFLLVDLRQPGIEVRPIRQLTGESDFCEVFFTDAECPIDSVVGPVNGGWRVAMSLLGFERGRAAATLPIRFRAELDALIAVARERGCTDEPRVRQGLARAHARVEIMRYLGLRTLTSFLAGRPLGPEAGMTKLYWSEYHRDVTELAVAVLGPEVLTPTGRVTSSAARTDGSSSPGSVADWLETFLFARADTIYAGSSQIQRNIIGEMLLGLPKEPRHDPAARPSV